MFSTVALIAVVSFGAADLHAGTPTLGAVQALDVPGTWQADAREVPTLTLRSPVLETAARLARMHPGRPAAAAQQQPSNAGGAAHAQTGGGATHASGTAAGASPPTARGGAAAETGSGEEPDIELLRQRARITRVHRILGISTFASLVVTEFLGTFLALNRPTVFGDGTGCRCELGLPPGALNPLHEISAFITVGLYAATGIFALSMPDPEHASAGNDRRGRTLRVHKALAWVHLTGMALQPILGVLSYDYGALGIHDNAHSDFARDMRTVHIVVGYATLAALTAAMVVELL
jgi:hypothetical protein